MLSSIQLPSSIPICSISCSISLIFIIGMIYMTLMTDKTTLINPFMDTLNKKQQSKYKELTKERATIYLTGFSLGFILSLGLILIKSFVQPKYIATLSGLQMGCIVSSITFVTTYFYYILSRKSDYMIHYLETPEQKTAWLSIYKTMQFNYHFGLVLGIASVFLLGFSLC